MNAPLARQKRIWEIDGVLQDMDTGEVVEPSVVMRWYQEKGVIMARASISLGRKRPLLVMPTAAGKSVVYGQIIYLARQKGKKCLFLVHRRNLVKQFASTMLKMFGIRAGMIMAGEEYEAGLDVYVSTVQTYHRRLQLEKDIRFNKFMVDADIIFTDESHTTTSKRYQDIFEVYSDKIIIGTTATPLRADGTGLGEVYDDLLDIIDVKQLTDEGFLCPVKYYEPTEVDLSKLKGKKEYTDESLSKTMDKPKLVGDVVKNWLNLAANEKTIVFAVNVKHSIHLRDEFIKNGIPAAHLDAHSSDDERDAIFKDMDEGRITVVCNVALYIEGMDVPDISCVCMARPTKSIGLYRQCIGRGLRISSGKTHLRVLDFGGVIAEHGYVADEIEWSLDGKNVAWKKKENKEKDKKPMKCPSCHAIVEGAKVCPECQTELRSFGKNVDTVDADLQESTGKKKFSKSEKRRWYGMFLHYSRSKMYKDGWVYWKYKDKIGCEPRSMKDVAPIEPDQEFRNYMKYIQIKAAKSKNNLPPRNEIERLARNLPGMDK